VAAPDRIIPEREIEVASGRASVAEWRRRVPGRDDSLSAGRCRVATTDTLVIVDTGVVASRKSKLSGGDGRIADREGRVRRCRSDLAALEGDESGRD
jgi:hypothetical protein